MAATTECPWIRTVRQVIQSSEEPWFRVQPARYWCDFGFSVVLAYTAGSVYLAAPPFSLLQLLAFIGAVFWLYRLGSLVHEVCHLAHHEMRVFKTVWNLAVGVITLTPSPFFTRHHRDHHSQRWYGTPEDPEYIVNLFQPGSAWSMAKYVLHLLLFPLIVFLRFLLTPLTFLHPRLREWVLTHASSLTMNRRYSRKITGFDRRVLTGLECLCFFRAALIPFAAACGWTSWSRLPLLYALALGVLIMNQMRLLADHHFESRGERFELADHIFDSCNFTGRDPLTWLFFPFSIRYHALHHLFPSLPYHNLAAAHRFLLRELPAGSPYRTLDQRSWWTVARRTLRRPTERSCAGVLVLAMFLIPSGPASAADAGTCQVVAHRGLLRQAPENTLANFRACLELRLGFEFDVQRSRDGHLVCVHDETVDRTTNGKGRVSDLTLKQLQDLDAGSWFDPAFARERIPAVDEVLATLAQFPHRVLVAVDLKAAGVESDVVRLARQHRVLGRLLFIGRTINEPEVRKRLKQADPQAQVARLANEASELAEAIADPAANYAYVRFIPTADEVARIRQAGKQIFIAGPVVAGEETEHWRRCLAVGVDAILTDFPFSLSDAIRQPRRPVPAPATRGQTSRP